jgi:ATP-dependent helicase/nuclease subunit A
MSDAARSSARDARRSDDTESRRLAQREFERPLLLQAGAGTGKTSVLVARVVAWCLGPGWTRAEQRLAGRDDGADPEAIAGRVLERVVAITFTEAAAAEMEERIGRTLQQLGQEAAVPHETLHLDPDALPGDRELERTRARALLAAFDRLRVSTIHAFCRRLLAEHPREAGVHPRFEIDATGRARAEAARATIEAWLGNPARADDDDFLALFEADVGSSARGDGRR